MLRNSLLLVVSCVLLPACGEEREIEGLASDYGAELQILRELNAQHREAVDRAETMTEVRMMEEDHRMRMDEVMGEMGDIASRLEACERICCFEGSRMMQNMSDELDEHRSRINAAADVAGARSEEHQHQGRVTRELEEMETDHIHMMGMMGMEMDCEG